MSEDSLSPSEIYKTRLKKLEELRQKGYDPYSLYFAPQNTITDLLKIETGNQHSAIAPLLPKG